MNFSSGQNKVAANTRWPYSVNGVVLRWGSIVKNNANQQQQALTLKVQLWLCGVVIAVKQPRKRKKYAKTRTTTRTGEKEQNEGQQTLYFGCLAPHIRHLFVTNFHYDGNIRRHLEARNNQSAMTNLPT